MHVSDLRSLTTRASALYLKIKKHLLASKLAGGTFLFSVASLIVFACPFTLLLSLQGANSISLAHFVSKGKNKIKSGLGF